jgi:biotin operon repressor
MTMQHSTKDLLMMLAGRHPDRVPSEFYNRQDIGRILGLRRSAANEAIRDLTRSGHVIETRNFRVLVNGNMLKPTPHYRFSKQAASILRSQTIAPQSAKPLTAPLRPRKTD